MDAAHDAADAGLNQASDDTLTAYADTKNAVIVTHDREFSQRRAKNVVGRHVQLRCPEWDAAALMDRLLDDIVDLLNIKPDVLIQVSAEGCEMHFPWK
ncbi:DUF5615 family PIN-like protein [Jiangella rhizosphaerae]|uniref:DUF5615 domain-containing protein n=1 Tax=Jiangella rhizosphaerae TaxID=2293569 RepID=A0A418KHK7_9ACTN|nr:DUF5615 family PIN-like protein [Jiangella rhizosphaerae]RIQ11879.1 hypothetical protein DY240_27915 [Jiangella rhizosphaerae]